MRQIQTSTTRPLWDRPLRVYSGIRFPRLGPARRLIIACCVPFLVTLALVAASRGGQVTRFAVAPGIEFTQEIAADGPLVVDTLRVDLKRPGIRVQSALGRDVVITDEPAKGREPVREIAERHGAVAAVNGDFFPFTGQPLGIAIRDGELISEGYPHRVVLGFRADGSAVIDTLLCVGTLVAPDGEVSGLDGINRLPGKNEAVLQTPSFGLKARADPDALLLYMSDVNLPVMPGKSMSAVAAAPSPIGPSSQIPPVGATIVARGTAAQWLQTHCKPDSKVAFRFDLVPNPLPMGANRGNLASRAASLRGRLREGVWSDVTQAVGGGPWLVRDGKIAIDGLEEGLSETEFMNKRHPRTAAGITANGELLLVAVDGRQSHSRGATLAEMADIMLRLGATRAINLDGGGSTSMVVKGLYVNSPSDGEPRPVANALLIYSDSGTANSEEKTADPIRLPAGRSITFSLPDELKAETGGCLWGTADGRAYVDQAGRLTAIHAGQTGIVAANGKIRLRFPLEVEPGPPTRIKAAFTAVANNPPDRNLLVITVADAYGNPLANQTVQIKVTGGQAEKVLASTDNRGRIEVEVVWDSEMKRQAVVSCGAILPVLVAARPASK